MKIKQIVCDILDREEKRYVTIGDVGKATLVIIGTLVIAPYLLYHGLSIWKAIIECPSTTDPFLEGFRL